MASPTAKTLSILEEIEKFDFLNFSKEKLFFLSPEKIE